MPHSDFWACSIWEFSCAVAGWNKAQGGDANPEPPSDEDHDRMLQEFGFA